MKRAGYSTGAFVSHVYVSSIFGFDRGFETFEDFGVSRPSYRPEARMEPAADRVTDAALAWLSRQGRRPVFLFVHYFDAHWPYEPPERFRALYPDDYHGPLDATYDSISSVSERPSRPEGRGSSRKAGKARGSHREAPNPRRHLPEHRNHSQQDLPGSGAIVCEPLRS